ncbi:type I restriction enzyme endonuclease domain-containing protein, partial [Crateriforma conspicua]|uniref:type I restriction enzyme endonuclease domain-containing protein n=1 Tax=Crateriforma conspicua TaxID=2527996 RepID=UPI0011B4FADF
QRRSHPFIAGLRDTLRIRASTPTGIGHHKIRPEGARANESTSYNERDEESVLVSDVLDDFSGEIVGLIGELRKELEAGDDLGIGLEEKAFYDILKSLATKYDFIYPEDKLIELAKAVKLVECPHFLIHGYESTGWLNDSTVGCFREGSAANEAEVAHCEAKSRSDVDDAHAPTS